MLYGPAVIFLFSVCSTIAVCKWIGTLTPVIYGNLHGINIYILLTGIMCTVFELIYIYFLQKFRKTTSGKEKV